MKTYEEKQFNELDDNPNYKPRIKFWDDNGKSTKTLSIRYETFQKIREIIIADAQNEFPGVNWENMPGMAH